MSFNLKKDIEEVIETTSHLSEEERQKQLSHGTKDIWGHLTDLRSAMMKTGLYFLGFFLVAFALNDYIYTLLTDPLYEALSANGFEKKIIFRKIQAVAMFQLETSFDTALILSLPILIFKVWEFVSDGLYEAEKALAKKYSGLFISVIVLFFSLGIYFAYQYLIPFTYQFLLSYAKKQGEYQLLPDIDLEDYLSFFTRMLIGCGFIALTPVIMAILSFFNMISAQAFISKWRIQFVISFIFSAILTPTTDYMTQTLMAAPMIGFYWIGIGITLFIERSRAKAQ